MRTILLAAFVAFIVPVIASVQQRGNSSVCLKDVPPEVLLNIHEHEWGMAERIGFGYDEKKLGTGPVIRDILKKKGFETYVTRVRVSVEGILREETHRMRHDYPYRFIGHSPF